MDDFVLSQEEFPFLEIMVVVDCLTNYAHFGSMQWVIPKEFIHAPKCGELMKKLEKSN